MRSMTGFGLGDAPLRGGRVSSEVRSLNHRFLELRVRLPPEIADQTFFVEQVCRERLSRGRYDVSVRIDAAALPPFEMDIERARSAFAALERLRNEVCPESELSLASLAPFPTLFVTTGVSDPEPLRTALAQSLGAALGSLDEMRGAEGASLRTELALRPHRLAHLAGEPG